MVDVTGVTKVVSRRRFGNVGTGYVGRREGTGMTTMGFVAYDGRHVPARDANEPMEDRRMEAARLGHEAAATQLSERDREILEFERQWWKYAGAKEQAIRDLFDMSATRYYQIINGLIDTPEALAFDPMLVKRLRRMRASRQRARSARRLGIEL